MSHLVDPGARPRIRSTLVTAALGLVVALPAGAQQSVTLEQAVDSALARAPRIAVARADSGAARAGLRTAARYPNPVLAMGYSESTPRWHAEIELEVDYPWVRGPRIEAARATLEAASLETGVERARLRYEVVSAYAGAAAARQIVSLSSREAADGVELLRIARERRDAGDASDLEVDLARVNEARLRSTLYEDSVRMATTTLELQSLMGLPVDSVRVVATDTLPGSARTPAFPPLALAAGEAARRAADRRLAERSRARFPAPSLRAGVEWGDPTGGEPGALPTLGLGIPLPLFNRDGGAVAEARAEAERAEASLAEARREATLALAVADRQRALAAVRLDTDRDALESAGRVASLALTAYREGAYTLASVLEAQRNAREAERRVLEDVAMLRTADAALTLARHAGVRP